MTLNLSYFEPSSEFVMLELRYFRIRTYSFHRLAGHPLPRPLPLRLRSLQRPHSQRYPFWRGDHAWLSLVSHLH